MSEARALTSTISNCVACIVVSIWEKACDRTQLATELGSGYVRTEEALEHDEPMPAPSLALVPQHGDHQHAA